LPKIYKKTWENLFLGYSDGGKSFETGIVPIVKIKHTLFKNSKHYYKSRFGDFVDRIYLIDTTDTARPASYLDLHLEIDSEGWLRTKLYNKRDDFNIPIVNFPAICSNIPAATVDPIFQSLWFLWISLRGLLLTRRLPNQGFLLVKLKSLRRKLYGCIHDMVNHFGISVSQMSTDMFHLS
jgi:hypothetical protein